MDKEIEKHIRSLSDADLIEYINAPSDTYLPEAIAFAKEEADSRHLSLEQVQRAEEEIAAQEAERLTDEDAPLDPFWRFFVFIVPINIIFVIPAWLRFRQTGERRKIRQFWGYWFAGVALWSILCALLGLLKSHPGS